MVSDTRSSSTHSQSSPGRSVAFIAYYFPPLGGGGTPRSVKFCKFLPQHGWSPTVFTGSRIPSRGNREFEPDASQFLDLGTPPPDIIRVCEDSRIVARLKATKRLWPLIWFGAYPLLWESELPWARRVVDAVAREHVSRQFEIVYASAAPFSSLLAGARISNRLGIPFIADLRDLWTRDSMKFFPSRMHYLWESHLERSLLSRATKIIANTPGSARSLIDWLGDAFRDRIVTIPNGYDLDDLDNIDTATTANHRDRLTIVHAGTLYEPGICRSRLGRYRPFALRDEARSILPLARGLLALERKHPNIAASLHVRLIGYTPHATRTCIDQLGAGKWFTFEGVVTRSEALAAMGQADALLILQLAFEDSERPVPYVPGKVYEYLSMQKPILAPVPRGDLRDLLATVPAAYVTSYEETDAIADSLFQLYQDVTAGKQPPPPPRLNEFARRYQAGTLAREFALAAVNSCTTLDAKRCLKS